MVIGAKGDGCGCGGGELVTCFSTMVVGTGFGGNSFDDWRIRTTDESGAVDGAVASSSWPMLLSSPPPI
jgi:hypothetical protein